MGAGTRSPAGTRRPVRTGPGCKRGWPGSLRGAGARPIFWVRSGCTTLPYGAAALLPLALPDVRGRRRRAMPLRLELLQVRPRAVGRAGRDGRGDFARLGCELLGALRECALGAGWGIQWCHALAQDLGKVVGIAAIGFDDC